MTNYLIDENLSRKMIKTLANSFNNITHVLELSLSENYDWEIWKFAKKNNYVIITKDNDFKHLSEIYGCPPKVIRFNCGNRKTTYIINLFFKHDKIIKAFANQKEDCYLELV